MENERLARLEERADHQAEVVASNARLTEALAETVKRHASVDEVKQIETIQREHVVTLARHDERLISLNTRVDRNETPRWRQLLSGGQSAVGTVDRVKHPVRVFVFVLIGVLVTFAIVYRAAIGRMIDRRVEQANRRDAAADRRDSLRTVLEIERLRAEQARTRRRVQVNSAELDTLEGVVDSLVDVPEAP